MLRTLWRQFLERRHPRIMATLSQGMQALEAGDAAEAERIARSLGSVSSTRAEGHFLRALIWENRGSLPAALAALREALALAPGESVYRLKLAQVLSASSAYQESAQEYASAFADPDAPFQSDPQMHFAAAGAYERSGQEEPSVKHLRRALAIDPGFFEAQANLAILLHRLGAVDQALQHLDRAFELRPSAALQLRRALMMPTVLASAQQIAEVRTQFAQSVQALLEGPGYALDDPAANIGATAFLLAYHGLNDRPLMEMLARAVRKGLRSPSQPPRQPAAGSRLVVGFASASLYSHSVGRALLEIIRKLDRSRIEVVIFSLEPRDDPVSAQFATIGDCYLRLPKNLNSLRAAIRAHPCDVLVYPDIGLDAETYYLAFERLAPVQCALAGHPVTSGLGSIDFFVSGAAEAPGAEAHYTEQMVRIPGFFLSICDPPPMRSPLPAAQAGKVARYLVPQTVIKLHPDFDELLLGLLQKDPQGEVTLFGHGAPAVDEAVKSRLLKRVGGHFSRIRFSSRLEYGAYQERLGTSHAVLDTRHFGGGNTTLEALACGVPVVTWPSEFLRGRFAWNCCNLLGLDECMADNASAYVERAIELARHGPTRDAAMEKIHAGRARLFQHDELAAGFQQFLLQATELRSRP